MKLCHSHPSWVLRLLERVWFLTILHQNGGLLLSKQGLVSPWKSLVLSESVLIWFATILPAYDKPKSQDIHLCYYEVLSWKINSIRNTEFIEADVNWSTWADFSGGGLIYVSWRSALGSIQKNTKKTLLIKRWNFIVHLMMKSWSP